MNWEAYKDVREGLMIELEHGGVTVEVGGRDDQGAVELYSWQAFTGSSDASGYGDLEHCKRAAVTAYALLVRLEGDVPDAGVREIESLVDGSWRDAERRPSS